MRKNMIALTVFSALAVNSVCASDSTSAAPAAAGLALPTRATFPVIVGQEAPLTIDTDQTERALVFVFLSARCPCSTSHEAKLRQYAVEFGTKGFTFIGIHANADEPQAEARKHFEESRLGFPVVRDDGSLANALGALKTPHIFVVAKDRTLLYSGGVDDSKDATRAKREFLHDALVEIAAGKTPQVREARTLGCIIKRKSP